MVQSIKVHFCLYRGAPNQTVPSIYYLRSRRSCNGRVILQRKEEIINGLDCSFVSRLFIFISSLPLNTNYSSISIHGGFPSHNISPTYFLFISIYHLNCLHHSSSSSSSRFLSHSCLYNPGCRSGCNLNNLPTRHSHIQSRHSVVPSPPISPSTHHHHYPASLIITHRGPIIIIIIIIIPHSIPHHLIFCHSDRFTDFVVH